MLTDFARNPIFGSTETEDKDDTGPRDDGNRAGDYARENLNLIGLSVIPGTDGKEEAIIVDRKENMMHFLKLGEELTAGEQKLHLKEIHGDHVVLSDGTEDIIVK